MDHTVSYRVDLQSRADGTRVPIMQRAQQVSDHLLARKDRQFFF